MSIQQPSNNNQKLISENQEEPIVNNSKSHVEIFIEKLLDGSPIGMQALMAAKLLCMANAMTAVFEKLGLARGKLGLALIQSGFNSANETSMAGFITGLGGLALGAAGVTQGIGNFQQAEGIALATEKRAESLELINNKTAPDDLEKGITIQVEALDEPGLTSSNNIEGEIVSDVEEEVFYDAEETLSSKSAKSKEQVEEQTTVEKIKAQKKITTKEEASAITRTNKDYDVEVESVKAKANKFQGALLGQGAQIVSQGLAEHEKSKAQKDSNQQQVEQDTQTQVGNTADHIQKNIDGITAFDPFGRNSSSLRG